MNAPAQLFDVYIASETEVLIVKRGIGLDESYRIVTDMNLAVTKYNRAVNICVVSAFFDPNFKYWNKKADNITQGDDSDDR